MPTISPPTSAPQGFPMPPRMTAANIGSSRNSNPASKRSCDCSANITPATAVRAAAITHVARRTRSVSMPLASASGALSAVARIAVPRRVRWRSR